jgi:hypothetical protein
VTFSTNPWKNRKQKFNVYLIKTTISKITTTATAATAQPTATATTLSAKQNEFASSTDGI